MTKIARKFNKVISLGVKFPICKLNQSIFRVTVNLSSVRYAQAFGRAELFIFNSLAARINPCPDTSSGPKESLQQP